MASKSKNNSKREASDGDGRVSGQQPRRGKSLQRFTFATVKRSTISPFECNPRTIDRSAARKLRESVRKFGLVEPLVVNRRTVANGFPPEQDGQLVLLGGHQRAAASDQLAGYDSSGLDADPATLDGTPVNDYDVPAAISEVNSAAEKALVIALNNPSLQGSWDSELLERLVTDPEVNITDTGFDRATLGLMFDQFIVDGVFGKDAAEQVAAEAPIIDIFDDMKAAGKEADAAKRDADKLSSAVAVPPENQAQFSDNDQNQNDSGELQPERISTTDYSATNADDRRIAAEREAADDAEQSAFHSRTPEEILAAERERKIAERQKYIEKAAFDRDTHFMLMVVAETTDELAAWLDELGIELPANRIVSLADLREAIDCQVDDNYDV